jgi:glycosyltransferase involved in cell wall biosynthesis
MLSTLRRNDYLARAKRHEERVTVLADIKPSLEGFAGIPQESRLLFRTLNCLPSLIVTGLIQSGASSYSSLRSSKWHAIAKELALPVPASTAIENCLRPLSVGASTSSLLGIADHVSLALSIMTRRPVKLHAIQSPRNHSTIEDLLFRPFIGNSPHSTQPSGGFVSVKESRKSFSMFGSFTKPFSGNAIFPLLDTSNYNFFISQNPFPGRTLASTRHIVRYHDATPLTLPAPPCHVEYHKMALECNIRYGAIFCCPSNASRDALLSLYPTLCDRSFVIPNSISPTYLERSRQPIAGTELACLLKYRLLAPYTRMKNRCDSKKPYFLLVVSSLEPRKNIATLIEGFRILKDRMFKNLKLIIVGKPGITPSPEDSKAFELSRSGHLFFLNDPPPFDLRWLYSNAAATICPSIVEGFDYPGAEAMASGGCVSASDTPVHREIYSDAAVYFQTKDSRELAHAIESFVGVDANHRRQQLIHLGESNIQRFKIDATMRLWEALLVSTSQTPNADTF